MSHALLGADDTERWRLLIKCALDGMHSLRRQVLDVPLDTERESRDGGETVSGRHTEWSTSKGLSFDSVSLGSFTR